MKQKFPSRGTILKLIEQSLDEGREKQVIERLQWFLHYSTHGSVSKTCKEFEIARSTFYRWLNRFDINDFSKLTDNSTNSLQLTTNNQKLLLGSRAAFLLALFLINLGVLLFALPTLASAASSWNPTLLVNTEAFQQIDDDDTDSDVYLEFGDTLQEKLLYKRSETRFETTRDLRVAGALTATGSIASSGSITASGNLALNSDNGAINATITFGNDSGAETLTFNDTSNAFDLSDDLNVTGTMSGKRLSFGDHFSGSGTVKWQNITDSTTQFQILDADGGNPVLNVDTTNERVGIGTASPVGNLHIQSSDGSISDVVDANSDDLIIESSGNVAVTVGAGTGNKGRFYFADSEDIDAGEIQFDHATDKFHFRSKGNGFTIDSSGNVGIGTTSPDTDLEVIASSVSDGIIVERSSSDRLKLLGDGTIYWGTTANQGRLSWDTGEAQILALSGNDLSLGSNGVADELYIKSGGKVGIGTTTPTEKLEVVGTASGSKVYASTSLASSGNLVIESTQKLGSGAVTVTTAEYQSGAYLYSSGASVLALNSYQGTQSGANAHILFGYRDIFDVSLYRSGHNDPGSGGLVVKTQQTGADKSAFEIYSNYSTVHNKIFKVTASGAVHADGAYNSTGGDYAEWFATADLGMHSGDIACLDPLRPKHVKRCNSDALKMIGIVSTKPGFIGNSKHITQGEPVLIGLIGQVPLKVIGDIDIGDHITLAKKDAIGKRATGFDQTVCMALEPHSGSEVGLISCVLSRNSAPPLNSKSVADYLLQNFRETMRFD